MCTAQSIPRAEEEEYGMANEEVLLEKIYKAKNNPAVGPRLEIEKEQLPEPVDDLMDKFHTPQWKVTDVYEYQQDGNELYYEINFKISP